MGQEDSRRIVLRNAFVVTGHQDRMYIDPGTVVVEGSTVASVGRSDPEATYPAADEVVDASGQAILPGLVNAHAHLEASALPGAFSDLGTGELALQMAGLLGRLKSPEFRYLAEAGLRLAALLHIKSGITAVNSMDMRPRLGAEILGEAGLRATFGALMGDYFIDEPVDTQAKRAEAFIDEHHGTRDGRIRASICPHGDMWASDEIWKRARTLADAHPDALVHTHLNEMPESRTYARYAGVDDPLAIAEQHGLVDERFCAAHFRKASDEEADRLAEAGAAAVHCPTIISYWSSGDGGWMPVRRLRDREAPVGLGLDDSYWHDSFDLFREAKTARLFANHYGGTPSLATDELLRMLTVDGARSMGIGDEVGLLAEGMRADLITVDLERAWMRPSTNVPARLVNTASNRDVTSTMVDGRFLMRDGEVQTVDESDVLGEAQRAVERFTTETDWELGTDGAEAPTLEALKNVPVDGIASLARRLGWQSLKEAIAGPYV